MDDLAIGATVQMTGSVMTGNVGTVVHFDAQRAEYLVRIDGATQNYFDADDLRIFDPRG